MGIKIFIRMCTVSLLVSCSFMTEGQEPEATCAYPITVEVEPPCPASAAKSSFTTEELNRISDLNIMVYHDGMLLPEHSRYFGDVSDVMMSFPCDKDGFNIYMVGNVGRLEPPREEADVRGICHVADTYADFRSEGFPVAEVFVSYRKGTRSLFRLKRLVGQYDISVRTSASSAQYVIKDVRLLNCALDVYPFSHDSKAGHFTGRSIYGQAPEGDALTVEDVERLSDGETVSLYFVENLQGVLLPDNTDRRKKIPSELEGLEPGLADKCTYIEVTADVITPAATYTDGKFRFYLGQDEMTDFSIRRNTLYKVTLDFTQNMVCEEEWRIEVGEPEVLPLELSKEAVHLVRGVDDYVLISGPRVKIDVEESDESDPSFCEYYLEDVEIDGEMYQKLSFTTDAEIDRFYEWSSVVEPFCRRKVRLRTVETYNGNPLVVKDVEARVYAGVFPICLRVESSGEGTCYRIEALTSAPVEFDLDLSAVLDVEVGTSSHKVYSSPSVKGVTDDGYRCCSAEFGSLKDDALAQPLYFRRLDVTVPGLYMGEGGEVFWGPGNSLAPRRFSDLPEGGSLDFVTAHTCSRGGCIMYSITGAGNTLFLMSPAAQSCRTSVSTGTSNSLSYDISDYNLYGNLPFYIINGDLFYRAPAVLINENAKYLDDSARKSIIYEMYGPGRDVFYPNGTGWGGARNGSPSPTHKFGYTAGLVKQFFGNVHTWQIYQDYECDFFMTVNGNTAWPGAKRLSGGFHLP